MKRRKKVLLYDADDDEAKTAADAATSFRQARMTKISKKQKRKEREENAHHWDEHEGNIILDTDMVSELHDTDSSECCTEEEIDIFVGRLRNASAKRKQLNKRIQAASKWRNEIFNHVNFVLRFRMEPRMKTTVCCFDMCTKDGVWTCYTCRNIGVVVTMCDAHVPDHAPIAHEFKDNKGEIYTPCSRRFLKCCDSNHNSSRVVRFHRGNISEDVTMRFCGSCAPATVLTRLGFFPGSPTFPSKLSLIHNVFITTQM